MNAPVAINEAPHIALDGVRVAFGQRVVFTGLSCGFARGRISVVLGGSGSGKSTLLRLVAGLVRPEAGTVRVAGEDITGFDERLLARVRAKIGMLFQGGALLDSLSVFDNLALPLREHTRLAPAEIAKIVQQRLDAVGVPDAAPLLPRQLSGGMLRRAALARAMVMNPEILLCDEPFSGLDPISVKRIEALLAQVNRQFGITVVIVSHHISSTLRLADRILLLLERGAVTGTPSELRDSPDPEIAGFFDEELDDSVAPGAAAAGAPNAGNPTAER